MATFLGSPMFPTLKAPIMKAPPNFYPLTETNSRKQTKPRTHITFKLKSFVDLKPESKPDFLTFDLPFHHKSDRAIYDVIIIGAGPAGLRLAERVSAYGIRVCCIDSSPLSMWPNNYGVWVDEFQSLGLEDCLDKTWPMTTIFLGDKRTKYLDRPYGRVNRKDLKTKLIEKSVSNGVKFFESKVWNIEHHEFESVVLCEDGVEVKGSLVRKSNNVYIID